jgi:hypothetical protein
VKQVNTLQAQLENLATASRAELIGHFEAAYRRSPPLRLSNAILALAVAYRWQEQALGGLKPEIRRVMLADKPTAIAPRASPGTILIREWQGKEHTVTVYADGVDYAGERLRSLTQAAFRITGQKRSGPAFFGLRKS